MCELLLVYTSLALFRMPYQDNYVLWKCIGFGGIGIFGTRFLVQWLYSEKHSRTTPHPPLVQVRSQLATAASG